MVGREELHEADHVVPLLGDRHDPPNHNFSMNPGGVLTWWCLDIIVLFRPIRIHDEYRQKATCTPANEVMPRQYQTLECPMHVRTNEYMDPLRLTCEEYQIAEVIRNWRRQTSQRQVVLS